MEDGEEQEQHLPRSPGVTTKLPDATSEPGQDIGGKQVQAPRQSQLLGFFQSVPLFAAVLRWITKLFTKFLAMFRPLSYGSATTERRDHVPPTFGLVQLFPDPEKKDETSSAVVDIIALPGLSAYAPTTFEAWVKGRDPSDGCVNWLKDRNMLPSRISKARILTYNWESNYKGTKSSAGFAETASSFLGDIHEDCKTTGRLKTPIVFIGSCFGGLLLAKALARAHERSGPRQRDYNQILAWTVGAIFLGTPFRGSWEFGLANAQKQIEFARKNNIHVFPELVEYLRPHNRMDAGQSPSPLNETVRTFFEIERNPRFMFPAVCFYDILPSEYDSFMKNLPEELKPTRFDARGQALVVPEESASIDGFEVIALNCRHSMLWKHSSPDDKAFVRICGRVEKLVEGRESLLWSRAKCQDDAELTLPRQIKEYLKVEHDDNEPYNESQKHHDVLRHHQLGTFKSFLESKTFEGWRKSVSASTLFCLGDAGVGKTVLASVVIDVLSKQVRKVRISAMAYLYCEYRFEKTNGHATRPTDSDHIQSVIDNYLQCILRQLISACPHVDDSTEDIYKRWKKKQRQPDQVESTKALKYVVNQFSKVYIVVDALDECSQGVRRKLLQTLSGLQETSGSRLHIMITSRFNVIEKIRYSLQSVQEMHISASKADIKLYLQAELEEISDRLTHHSGEAIRLHVVNTISETADGITDRLYGTNFAMFLLARFQLYSLASKTTDKEITEALNSFDQAFKSGSVRSSAGPKRPGRVQEIYTDMYHDTMKRIDSQEQEVRKRVKRALSWISRSPSALTVPMLGTVLGFPAELDRMKSSKDIDPKPFRELQIACAGLIKEERGCVRLIHYTTQQYLDDHVSAIDTTADRKTGIPQIGDDGNVPKVGTASSKHLMLSCIAYLALNDFDSSRIMNNKDLQDLRKVYPFHQYAAKNWARFADDLNVKFPEDTLKIEIFSRFIDSDTNFMSAAVQIYKALNPWILSNPLDPLQYLASLNNIWHGKSHLALDFVFHFGCSDIGKLVLPPSRCPSKYHIGTVDELLCSIAQGFIRPSRFSNLLGKHRMLEAVLEYGETVNPGLLSKPGKILRLAAIGKSVVRGNVLPLLREHIFDNAFDAFHMMILGVSKSNTSLVKALMFHRDDSRKFTYGLKFESIVGQFDDGDSSDSESLCDSDLGNHDP